MKSNEGKFKHLLFLLMYLLVGNWFSYSFGENSTGVAMGMMENQEEWPGVETTKPEYGFIIILLKQI